MGGDPLFIYASTNKVYGSLSGVEVIEDIDRYSFEYLVSGISENQRLDFATPYGCSKGAADQYVRDYANTYGMKTVVLRQSCIYGPHQNGTEEQGWIAHFMKCIRDGERITIYGDGKQVRDILYVDDLIDCYEAIINRVPQVHTGADEVYNIGGGFENLMSVWNEFSDELVVLFGEETVNRFYNEKFSHGEWRPSDQKCMYFNIDKAEKVIGWKPKTSIKEGLKKTYDWITGEGS